jgi:hypothetical protein
MKDWIIYKNINVEGYKDIIDNILTEDIYIERGEYSTRGYNSMQYWLSSKKDLFTPIQDKVKNEIKSELKEFKIDHLNLLSAWTVLGQENSYHTLHYHNKPINHISTVLYLDVPPEPTLDQPGDFYFLLKDENKDIHYNQIRPKVGDLIIMPVHTWHGAYPQAKGLRQTLNMDFEVI